METHRLMVSILVNKLIFWYLYVDELKSEIVQLKNELHEVKSQQEKTYKMVERIATSQNDLETNIYQGSY